VTGVQTCALPISPSFNEEDVSDKPLWVRSLPSLERTDIRRLKRLQRKRVQSLQAVDEAVGAIIDLLKQQRELNNTYIVFTSDNGLNMGEHRWTKKVAPYDESIGVPLLVRGPGVDNDGLKGAVRNHIVTNNDLAPTFASMGQIEQDVPDFVDGKSFMPLLGPTPPATADWRSATLIERLYQPAWTPGTPSRPDKDMPPYVAVRTANQLYVKYKSGESELYNLSRDPYQLNSRHAIETPQVNATIARFDAWLEALRNCTAAYCLAAESGPDVTAPDTEITQKPTDPSSSGEASFSFTGVDDATLPSDLAFQCRLDSEDEAAFAACSDPQTYSGLPTGLHTFEVRAIDEAGNVDAQPESYSWTVESPPEPPSP
jgi:N-acetylglucosamine-6-sulfatase